MAAATTGPIFVIGLPRSGTTLASQIISAHSEAGNAGELETMTYVAAKLRARQAACGDRRRTRRSWARAGDARLAAPL